MAQSSDDRSVRRRAAPRHTNLTAAEGLRASASASGAQLQERDDLIRKGKKRARNEERDDAEKEEVKKRAAALECQLKGARSQVKRLMMDLRAERDCVVYTHNEGMQAVLRAKAESAQVKKMLGQLIEWVDDNVPIKIAVTCPGRYGAHCMRAD